MRRWIFIVVTISISLWNRDVHSQTAPEIVSAGGSITEIIFALGQGHRVVAVDTSSLYPAKVNTLPKVGYYRQLSPEGVIASGTKLLLTHQGAGPENGLNQLQKAGIKVQVFDHPKTVDGLSSLIMDVAEATQSLGQGKNLTTSIKQKIRDVQKNFAHLKGKKVAFLMSVSPQGISAGGQDTVPNLIANTLSLQNVFAEFAGYKPVAAESLLIKAPDIILIPHHRAQGLSKSALCNTQALRFYARKHGCNIEIVDSLKFLGMTPRLPDAMRELANLLEG